MHTDFITPQAERPDDRPPGRDAQFARLAGFSSERKAVLLARLATLQARGMTPRQALLAVIEGDAGPDHPDASHAGNHDVRDGASVAALYLRYEALFVGDLVAGLDQALPGWFRLGQDPGFARDLLRELAETGVAGKPGQSGNPDARLVARHVAAALTMSGDHLNDLGGTIDSQPGWVAPMMHDPAKIARVSQEQWMQTLRSTLDQEWSFPGQDEKAIINLLDELRRIVLTGCVSAQSPMPGALQATSLLLSFRDADAWLEYHRDFGQGDIVSAIIAHQQAAARLAAQMTILGPSPMTLLQELEDTRPTGVLPSDPPSLQRRPFAIRAVFAEIPGLVLGAAPTLATQIATGRRAQADLARFGAGIDASLDDVVTAAAGLTAQGRPILDAYDHQLDRVLRRCDAKVGRDIVSLVAAGCGGFIDHVTASVHAADSLPGQMSQALSRALRYAEPLWREAALQAIAGRIMAAWLGSLAGQAWAELDVQTQTAFRRHDISAEAWENLRHAGICIEGEGACLPPAVIMDPVEKSPERGWRHADRIGDVARHLPVRKLSAAAASLLTAGDSGNEPLATTPAGQALRFIAGMKGFSLIAISRARKTAALDGRPGTRPDDLGKFDQTGHLGHVIADLLVAALLAAAAKARADAAPVETDPRRHPAVIRDALIRSGAASLYGDFLFGEAARFAAHVPEVAPGITGTDLMRCWWQVRAGDDVSQSARGGLEGLLRQTPFINLWYARAVLDFLLLMSLQESFTPGLLRRLEQQSS